MKKYIYIAVASLFAFAACEKEAGVQEEVSPVEEPEVKELVTITASIPEEGISTKVALEQDGANNKLIKLKWESTDQIVVNGVNFTIDWETVSGDYKTADFKGVSTPVADGSGKYNISYTKGFPNVGDDYNNQTQAEDRSTSHLAFSLALNGASDYKSFSFVDGNQGGSLVESSVLRLRAKLPSEASWLSDIEKVIFKSSTAVFNGSATLTVNLTTHGSGGDEYLDVYASLPAGSSVTMPDLIVQFQVSSNAYDVYTAYREFSPEASFPDGAAHYIGIDCSNIESYANKSKVDIGTSGNPYLIGDQHQMQAISLSTTKQYYKLVDDIDMTGVSWTSLNAEGTNIIDLDGNSKILSNMRSPLFADLNGNVYDLTLYNSVVSSAETVGILANTCNTAASTVSRVTVTGDESPKVSSLTNTATSGTVYVGGLIGKVYTLSTFDDCHVINTTIDVPAAADYSYTGGAFGFIHNSTGEHTCSISNFTIESCSVSSFSNTGGLIGYFERGNVNNNKVGYDKDGNAKKCIVTSPDFPSVVGDNKGGLLGVHRYGYCEHNNTLCTVKGKSNIGGLTGYAYVGESDCTSSGEVYATYTNAGGLVGYSRADITNCNSSCTVDGQSVTSTYVSFGGLIGTAVGGSIKKCYSTGKVVASKNQFGGLIGTINTTTSVKVDNCYTTGDVTGIKSSTGTIRGGALIGGISNGTGNVTISNCYATGKVTARRYSGFIGIVESDKLTVNYCYTSSFLDFFSPSNSGVFVGNSSTKTISYSGIIAWNTSKLANFIYNTTVTTAPDGNYFGTDGTINSQATTLGWALIVDDKSNPVWDLTWADNRPHLAWEVKP